MRKRRGPKVTWLPTFGNPFGEEGESFVTGLDSILEIPWGTAGAGALGIYPLTVDQPNGEDEATQVSLADAIGSEWFLRRIVGKLFIQVFPPSEGTPWFSQAQIAAGFLVARADHTDVNLPTGTSDLTTGPAPGPDSWGNFSPLAIQAMREPWIWRRKWILSINGWDAGGVDGFPAINVNYGSSSLDGPHIDAKTRRRISNDDRLYFAIAAAAWPIDRPLQEEGDWAMQMRFNLDYRIVGSLRKARNRGVF